MDGSSTAGLSWTKTADSISDFLRRSGSKPPRRAVFCTYDFDHDHFSQVLGPLLFKRRPFRSWVLVDSGALQALIHSTASFGRLQIAPVRCRSGGIFHPKIILMQAGSHYLAGLGSANLTNGGFGGNLELMLFADTAQEKGRILVQGVAGFLDRLTTSSTIILPEKAKSFIRNQVLPGIEPNQGTVLDSFKEPLFDQMKKILSDFATERIAVLSPWHSATENREGCRTIPLDRRRGRRSKIFRRESRTSVVPLAAHMMAARNADQTSVDHSHDGAPPVNGDVTKALAEAPLRSTGMLHIGGQERFYLEGQVALAVPGEDGAVLVYSSTQHPSEVQHIVARVLGLPDSFATCRVRRMGGGLLLAHRHWKRRRCPGRSKTTVHASS
jgi:Molybdopterin-binding domain of aldehyde dehydrogenase